uniref:Uncharacterized protein n=1 Tax=Trichogramma kaykai TaxID=54128 RepID=A0ABD2X4Q6_9HYME
MDHERSTPLHALARPCLCENASAYIFCSHRKPADEIVAALVKKEANVETRHRRGDTPLQVAVACFDGLSGDKMFVPNFTWTQLPN